MRRSQVNGAIREAERFLEERRFHLPPFAFWRPEEWRERAGAGEIIRLRLGWDITDFGSGDFARTGLVLFTLRNGSPDALSAGRGKLYCEKILIAEAGQVTPAHYHEVKTEDIINRGGGTLRVQVWEADPDGALSASDTRVEVDAVTRAVPAGGIVDLTPGESITLPPRLYHRFWPEGERTVIGEVSLVNDDERDNRFLAPVARFPEIDEDEPPYRLLVGDYATIGGA